MLRTANPALTAKTFQGFRATAGADTMTISGTVNRTGILLLLTFATAAWSWAQSVPQPIPGEAPVFVPTPWVWVGLLGGLVVALITVFKKRFAPITAPLYAILEGLALGAISAAFELRFPGIVVQAIMGTFGTLFVLLLAYKSGLIRATENFKLGVVAATGGIALLYVISFGLSLFGIQVPYIHESGPIGIAFSVFVVIIAALNLVLDFDFIENGAESAAPKYMEWYAAFGLLVTLVWLYLEILRLLAKVRSR